MLVAREKKVVRRVVRRTGGVVGAALRCRESREGWQKKSTHGLIEREFNTAVARTRVAKLGVGGPKLFEV